MLKIYLDIKYHVFYIILQNFFSMSDQNIDLKSHLMDYVMPNPVFILDQEKRSKYLHQVGDHLESVSKLFNHFGDMGEKICSTLTNIFMELNEVEVISSDSKYNTLLESFKSTTIALRSYFLGINEKVVQPLHEFVKKDLKTLKEYRKQYEHCSAIYDTAVERHVSGFQKHFSIGSSSNVLSSNLSSAQQTEEADSTLIQSHQQATEAFFNFSSQMSYIEEKLKYVLPNLFISYLSLFEKNFSTCLQDVADFKEQFNEIKAKADESNKTSQAQAKKDITDRHELQSFIPKFWEYVISLENKSTKRENKSGPISIGFTSIGSESSTDTTEESSDTNNPFDDFTYRTSISTRNSRSMQGFLWKKCHLNWKRRFFICNNGLLSYGKTVESTIKSPKEIDLLLCAAKLEPSQPRRNCFSVRTPDRKFILQALTAYEMNVWMNVILKNIIAKASNANIEKNNNNKHEKDNHHQHQSTNSPSSFTKNKSNKSKSTNSNNSNNKSNDSSKTKHHHQHQNGDDDKRSVVFCPSKNICADCGAKGASWVSVTWGVTLCTACAGVHRSLSSSVSFVRSIELDDIAPAQLMIIDSIGTKRANSLLEGKLIYAEEKRERKRHRQERPHHQHEEDDEIDIDDNEDDPEKREKQNLKKKKDKDSESSDYYEYDDDDSNSADDEPSITKIQPHESTQKRSLFIQQKYKALAFVRMPKSKSVPDVFDSIKRQCLIDVYNGLIFAKSKDAIPFIKGFSPLHASVCIGNPVILEFVLLQLPDFLNKLDDRGWSPLSYAAYYQKMPVVAFLLESGADPDASPSASHPWSIAHAKGNTELESLIKSFTKNIKKLEKSDFMMPDNAPHSEFGNLQSVHESALLMSATQQHKLKKLDTLSGDEIKKAFRNLHEGKNDDDNNNNGGGPTFGGQPSTFHNEDE